MIVRDRPDLTQQALKSLEENTTQDITVTIVDDQSQKETALLLVDWVKEGTNKRILVRNTISRGVGWARNLSIHVSETAFGRGELLYLADNDSYYTKDWLTHLLDVWPIAKGMGCKILGGFNHPFQRPNETYSVTQEYNLNIYNAVGTLSWLLEWETIDKYGTLSAHTKGVRQSEDWEFSQRIKNDGFKVGAITPHVVYHTGRTDTFGGLDPGAIYMLDIPGVTIK